MHTPELINKSPYISEKEQHLTSYLVVAFDAVLELTIVIYLVTAKNVRHVRLLLQILLAFEIFALLFVIFKPSIYTVLTTTLQTGFTVILLLLLRHIGTIETIPSKKAPQAPEPDGVLDQKRSPMKHPVLLTIGAIVSLLIMSGMLFGAYAGNVYKKNILNAHLFTASKDNFTIDFPGKVSTKTYPTQAGCDDNPFSFTEYTSSLNNDSQIYTVYVFPWPTQAADFVDMSPQARKSSLQYLLNDAMQAIKGHVIDSKFVYISPERTQAIEASFSRQDSGLTTYGYYRIFAIGNTEYDIVSQDSTLTAFYVFADSFQFTGPSTSFARHSNFPSSSLDAPCAADNSATAVDNVSSQSVTQTYKGVTSNAPVGNSAPPTQGTWANQPSGVPTGGTVTGTPNNQGGAISGNAPLSLSQ